MMDSDGATDIKDFNKIYEEIKKIKEKDHGIVVGSRHVYFENVRKERTFIRNILSYGSTFLIKYIVGIKINDTQCGFKLFTYETAHLLFYTLHLERWAFDVELFILANLHKIPVKEVAVNWKEVEGSKLNVFTDTFRMLRDFLLVKILYELKLWGKEDRYKLKQA